MAKHYTAVLEIIESDKTEIKDCGHSSYSVCRCVKDVKKRTSEVARIVVRAQSIEVLRRRLAAHIELIGGDDDSFDQIERKPR